jgi:hypothetical protein
MLQEQQELVPQGLFSLLQFCQHSGAGARSTSSRTHTCSGLVCEGRAHSTKSVRSPHSDQRITPWMLDGWLWNMTFRSISIFRTRYCEPRPLFLHQCEMRQPLTCCKYDPWWRRQEQSPKYRILTPDIIPRPNIYFAVCSRRENFKPSRVWAVIMQTGKGIWNATILWWVLAVKQNGRNN